MAVVTTAVVPVDGNMLKVKILTKVEAAARAAFTVFWCSAAGVLLANYGVILTALGNGSNRPDFSTLGGILQSAATAGVAGLVAFAFRYIKPKTTVAAPKA